MDVTMADKGELDNLSGSVATAKREPAFLERATRLFLLRDSMFKAYDNDVRKITKASDAEIDSKAEPWGWGGFALGGIATFAGVFAALPGVPVVLVGCTALFFGALVGGVSAWVLAAIASSGAESRKEERLQNADLKMQALNKEIDFEISGMEQNLMAEEPAVRKEFREIFKHAALKQDLRDQKIHRAKVEKDAEETREAAETASTMATIAAVNTAMTSMRR